MSLLLTLAAMCMLRDPVTRLTADADANGIPTSVSISCWFGNLLWYYRRCYFLHILVYLCRYYWTDSSSHFDGWLSVGCDGPDVLCLRSKRYYCWIYVVTADFCTAIGSNAANFIVAPAATYGLRATPLDQRHQKLYCCFEPEDCLWNQHWDNALLLDAKRWLKNQYAHQYVLIPVR